MIERFSDREGYRPPAAPITIREDAPSELRGAIPVLAQEAGMSPSTMREVICQVLLVRPDPSNWSEYPNIWDEVDRLVATAVWYKVYDIAEALYARLRWGSQGAAATANFARRLNDFLVEHGIGWELRDGRIVHRGSKAFAKSVHDAPRILDSSGFQRAANEMSEALGDISRRPAPDVTGAIQHAMAALEATAREVAGEPNPTLGKLVPMLRLPAPLDEAVHKLWGYASDRARHVREQQTVDTTEAELIVAVSGSLCAFLAQRHS
ncbi:MAG: hypothetical protein OXH83_20370 [Bryobacterales bacterium]|nr:hypothetical protein [Bryobacterales bacterium]